MKFHSDSAVLFIPNGTAEKLALGRTTHLAISAHQDDIEIMAAGPILDCYQSGDQWFTGVVVTDGRGSPRNGIYGHYSDDEMHDVRMREQCKAAQLGEYSAQILLDYPSSSVKDPTNYQVQEDLAFILLAAHPRFVYTHNLADKHDTHVATALRVIQAIRSLEKKDRPEKLIGCEVWRDLDWMLDSDKVIFDLSDQENLQAALLGVFDSQISGGKRYDLASLARRKANATYFESHGVDVMTGISFGMDMTPLLADDHLDPQEFVEGFISNFTGDVTNRIRRMAGKNSSPAERKE